MIYIKLIVDLSILLSFVLYFETMISIFRAQTF